VHKGEFYVLNVAFYNIVDEEGHFHNVPLDATDLSQVIDKLYHIMGVLSTPHYEQGTNSQL
jgi:hypothetical protein